MSQQDEAMELLNALCAELGAEPIGFDENNVAYLTLDFGPGLALFWDAEANALVASVILGPIDPGNGELLYELLCGNYMWEYSGSGTIAVDRVTGLLTIFRLFTLPAPDTEAFIDGIAALVGAARYWLPSLGQSSQEVAPAEALLSI